MPARKRAAKKPLAKKAMKSKPSGKFFILWNPSYHSPPKVRFPTEALAEARGTQMANELGDTFYVLQATQEIVPVKSVKKRALK